jgi:tetratricopeptide (TPR) repeat protein
LKKIEAASFLAPENKRYKLELARALYGSGMRFISPYHRNSFNKPGHQNQEDYKKALDIIEEAANLHMETDKRKLSNLGDFCASIRNIKNFNEYPEEIKQRTRKIHRLYVDASKSFLIKEFNVSPTMPVSTKKELKAYSNYVDGMTAPSCYISRSEWFEKATPLIIDWLDKANNFSEPPILWMEGRLHANFTEDLKICGDQNARKHALKLIERMKDHNSPAINIMGEKFWILYDKKFNNYSEKSWQESAKGFIEKGKALIASGKCNNKEKAQIYHQLRVGLRSFPLEKAHEKLILELYEFMTAQGDSSPDIALEAGWVRLSNKDYEKAYEIVQKALDPFNHNGANFLELISVYPKENLLELKREILAKKPDLAGKPQYPWKSSKILFDAGIKYIYGTGVKDKCIYAAVGSPYDMKFYKIDPENGKKTELGTYKAVRSEKQFNGSYPLEKITPSCVSDNYFIVGSPYGFIVCPLDGTKPFKIGENNGLPSGIVQALAFFDNKIYAGLGFCGGAFLVSYDLGSKMIDIISSTLRKKKENQFDKFNPFRFYGIYPDLPKKRLLIFIYADPYDGDMSGIWSYHIQSGTIKRIQRLEAFPKGLQTKKQNERIMLSSYDWLLSFDPSKDKTEIVFTSDSRIYKKYLKGKKPRLQWRCPGRCLEPPHLLMNEYICFSSPFIKVSTINKDVNKLPNLSEKKDFKVRDMELLSSGKAMIASRYKIWLIEF